MYFARPLIGQILPTLPSQIILLAQGWAIIQYHSMRAPDKWPNIKVTKVAFQEDVCVSACSWVNSCTTFDYPRLPPNSVNTSHSHSLFIDHLTHMMEKWKWYLLTCPRLTSSSSSTQGIKSLMTTILLSGLNPFSFSMPTLTKVSMEALPVILPMTGMLPRIESSSNAET